MAASIFEVSSRSLTWPVGARALRRSVRAAAGEGRRDRDSVAHARPARGSARGGCEARDSRWRRTGSSCGPAPASARRAGPAPRWPPSADDRPRRPRGRSGRPRPRRCSNSPSTAGRRLQTDVVRDVPGPCGSCRITGPSGPEDRGSCGGSRSAPRSRRPRNRVTGCRTSGRTWCSQPGSRSTRAREAPRLHAPSVAGSSGLSGKTSKMPRPTTAVRAVRVASR